MEIIDKIYMYPVATVIVNTIPCILLIFLTMFIKKRKTRVSVSLNQVLPFVIVPTSQIVLLIATWMLFNKEYYIKSKGSSPEPTLTSFKTVAIIIISAIVLCIIADFILFILIKRVSQNNAMREELRFMEYKNQTNLDYYRTIEKNAFETRKIRHDLNNILQVIYGLEESGAPDGEAISSIIADQLKNSIDSIKIEKFSENMLVNAIAANKGEICREKKIDFDFDLRVPEKTNIKEIDLCKAFVNIIDNAINAVSELAESERKIEISSFVDGDYLYIKSINPSPASNTKTEPCEGHGLGQKILTDIAENYCGKFITTNENGIYTALLTVKT
ncbi:MAG: sensor histidine kinase [Acutalibacteraceae bacterium]